MKKLTAIICGSMMMFSCSNEMDLVLNETKTIETEISEVPNNVTLDDVQTYMEKGSAIASHNGCKNKKILQTEMLYRF